MRLNFARSVITIGAGSGGDFACTKYVRGNRRLELHFRHALGLVTYYLGDASLTHAEYMRAVLGRKGGNHYPGFSKDPIDGFRHLRYDLEHYCGDFLNGSDEAFLRWVEEARKQPAVTGFRAVTGS